jgi:hypothetical protein
MAIGRDILVLDPKRSMLPLLLVAYQNPVRYRALLAAYTQKVATSKWGQGSAGPKNTSGLPNFGRYQLDVTSGRGENRVDMVE